MDLRPFISQLEGLKELELVEGADWNLEIGAITELSNERNGPALLFDRIRGYPSGYRVISNLMATPRRLAIAFGFPSDISNIDLVRRIKDKFKELKPIPPTRVPDGPVLENLFRDGEVDLLKFPTPKWHEYDGGRYIGTADMVIMKDPKGGWVNVGTYRVQVHDANTLGLHIVSGHQGNLIRQAYWAEGKSCPVAVVFGAHPLVWMPSFLAFPWGTEEYNIVGGLLGEPLQVITGEYTGLPIPAHAEIAVEGDYLAPEVESRIEGPFGEWRGYYGSGAHDEPVLKVKRVMHRRDPIIVGAPPLKPPACDPATYVMRSANIWYEMERLGLPGIKGVWHMRAGGSRFFNVISIEQKYAGHAKQVAMAAMSGPEGAWEGRFVIVVDDDIDPTNDEDVLWAMGTRCDPGSDIEILRGCWTTGSDPRLHPEQKAKGDLTCAKAIVLACRPYYWKKDFPRVNKASEELRATTLKKWSQLLAAK